MPNRVKWLGVGAGCLLGLFYSLSPSTFIALLVIGVLFYWAQQGATPRERRWVLGVLWLSLAARLAALARFFLFGGAREALPVLVGDEWLIKWRGLLQLHVAEGRAITPTDYFNLYETYGRTGLMNVFAAWQAWVGPAPYGVHMLNVVFWYAGSVMLYRTARRSFGAVPALAGLGVVLFFPTPFVWSISALKEPIYFVLTAATIVGGTAAVSSPRVWQRLLGLACTLLAVLAIDPIRSIALFVAAGGACLGFAGWLATRRAWIGLVAMLVVGLVGMRALNMPAVQDQLMRNVKTAATAHIGNVITVGYSYRLLDARFYHDWQKNWIATMQPEEAIRFVGRAAVSFVTQPLPWRAESTANVALIAQQVLWYVLAALVPVGIVAGFRRHAGFTWMLIGNIAVGAVVVSVFNGNVGTLVRMRDSVVTIIVWLSALGGVTAVESMARRFLRMSPNASN